IMLGKLVPYFGIGMFDVIVCALIAIYWFHVPFRGSFLTLIVSSAMFMVVVLSLGFFISVIAGSQLAASQIALLVTFLPAFLLSGFLYAIEQMPVVLQWITRILPARYYVSVLKKVFLKGTPTASLYPDLVPLAVFTIMLALLATPASDRRCDQLEHRPDRLRLHHADRTRLHQGLPARPHLPNLTANDRGNPICAT